MPPLEVERGSDGKLVIFAMFDFAESRPQAAEEPTAAKNAGKK